MTIEIMHGQSEFIYRTRPGDPRIIERKKNKRGGRWSIYQPFGTAELARRALWDIEHREEEETDAPQST